MRVALVGTGVLPIPPPGYGGVERTIDELRRALASAGAEVAVVDGDGGGRAWREYPFAWGVPRRLRSMPHDVVHASTPVVANRLAAAHIPYVYTTHSRHWFDVEGPSQRFGFWLERRAVRRAAATIALTDRLDRRMHEVLGPTYDGRFDVVPIGVDTASFRPRPELRTGTRAVGVGVVRPFKRWHLAAEALRGTGLSLTIVGPTPDAAYARTVVAAGDHVELVGECPSAEMGERLAASDLMVHPSRVELLAGAVLQGLASGLPVLGAEPIASLVEEGRTGFLAPPGSDDAAVVRSIRDGATRLAADATERARMSAAARASAEARFAWPTVARRHLEIYGRVVGRGA